MLSSQLQPLPQTDKASLLTLPPEIRTQIYTYAFANQILAPYDLAGAIPQSCHKCLTSHQHNPSTLFTIAFRPLITNRQIHTEATPIFYSTLTLHLTTAHHLSSIAKSPTSLLALISNLTLTIHLKEETRPAWRTSLTTLPSTFPHLTHLTISNHMRPPTSYDHLTDALYLCSPLVLPCYPTSLTITLDFSYARDEVMFESPLLGDITTDDSLAAHEAVIRDLLADEGFRAASCEGDGEGDFEGMTTALLAVARTHEQGWLEDLQRRRLGGLSVREVQERVARSVVASTGVEGVGTGGGERRDGNGDGDGEESGSDDWGDDGRDENGWTTEDWAEYRRRVREETDGMGEGQ